jgi:alkanesulfonate monooxygenase SsuD/methylene tetrahydromethanopterin reductase-like flavin-dependent oxidoreductase (luciferase family)
MQIGIDSFAAAISDPTTGLTLSPVERMHHLLEEIELAERVGLDVFGIGEHHRAEFLDSAPVVILSATATRTENIRLTSAVTVLSASDPVRVFQEFATLDLISRGRAEIVAGRGSFIESYPLFGLRLEDYDSLFAEKLDLLLKIRASTQVHWSGNIAPHLPGRQSTLARSRIRCRYGSVSAARPNLSFVQVCSDFPLWWPSSAVNLDASAHS